MKWLVDIIELKLSRWHLLVHSNNDFMSILEANKAIDRLQKENEKFRTEVKKLKLRLEIKKMNGFLETGRV